jgi:hypothetical protein
VVRAKEAGPSIGIARSKDFVEWVRVHRLALVAADTFAVECLPPVDGTPFLASAPHDQGMTHQELLAELGMPLGELWRLDHLTARMRATGPPDAGTGSLRLPRTPRAAGDGPGHPARSGCARAPVTTRVNSVQVSLSLR